MKKQADSAENSDRQLVCIGRDAKTDDATLTYTEVEQEGETRLCVIGLEARNQMVKAQMLAHQARPEFIL